MKFLPALASIVVCATWCGTGATAASLRPGADFAPPAKAASEQVLYSFQGGNDGANPQAPLAVDGTGSLYGTTVLGGNGNGTIFKLTPSGSTYVESIPWRFTEGNDGSAPHAGLVVDSSGAFYGTASGGGKHGFGCVFKLTSGKAGYTLTPLYGFAGPPDGSGPIGGVLIGASGVLYGTTESGGTSGDGNGTGTVFALTPSGNAYTESVLLSFDGVNGIFPYAGLITDASGALYGTTFLGGTSKSMDNPGYGTAFKLSPNGSGYIQTVLWNFQLHGGSYLPYGGLVEDSAGNLFGVTNVGGPYGAGSVYELSPTGSTYALTFVHNFDPKKGDGGEPFAESLLLGKDGSIYGTTEEGGTGTLCTGGCGTVFELKPGKKGYTEKVIYSFRGEPDGSAPAAGLIADANGTLYGTTYAGGQYGYGTAFEVTP